MHGPPQSHRVKNPADMQPKGTEAHVKTPERQQPIWPMPTLVEMSSNTALADVPIVYGFPALTEAAEPASLPTSHSYPGGVFYNAQIESEYSAVIQIDPRNSLNERQTGAIALIKVRITTALGIARAVQSVCLALRLDRIQTVNVFTCPGIRPGTSNCQCVFHDQRRCDHVATVPRNSFDYQT